MKITFCNIVIRNKSKLSQNFLIDCKFVTKNFEPTSFFRNTSFTLSQIFFFGFLWLCLHAPVSKNTLFSRLIQSAPPSKTKVKSRRKQNQFNPHNQLSSSLKTFVKKTQLINFPFQKHQFRRSIEKYLSRDMRWGENPKISVHRNLSSSN